MAQSINIVHEMINKVGFEFNEADAKKVSNLAEKAAELAAKKMTKELGTVVKEIGEIFNKALGKNTIDFSDLIKAPDNNAIKTLTERFVSQLQSGISKGISKGGGLTEALRGITDPDEIEQIEKEFGSLEEKLERLKDLADEYGVKITQRNRDRHEELNQKEMDSGLTSKEEERMSELYDLITQADEALVNFEQTYNRVILKLANGKKVEILPDDKGLGKFAKFADGWGEEYDGIEIEDIVFERAKAETAANEQIAASYDELKTKVEAYYETRQRVMDIADKKQSGDILSAMEEVSTAEKDILKYFGGKNDDVSAMLSNPDSIVATSLEHIAKLLGVEIPMAANNAAETAIDNVVEAVQAAKKDLAASSTTLGILDGENEYGPTINTIKEKQKTLKGYLNELTAVVKKEKENGELTEEEIARKRELTGLINRLDLAVRYQDGSYFQTGEFGEIGIAEDHYSDLDADEFLAQLEQLNKIVNLRKKIALGYYDTGTYDTYEDTFNGDKVKNLVTSSIWARDDGDVEQFDASMIGQLTREYQYLHEQMLKCMLVGEEVPEDVIDRMKWFENISTEELNDVLPRLTELQQKIDEIRNNDDGSIFSWRYNADDKYYDDKIQDLQTLLALQEEYVKLGGPTDSVTGIGFSLSNLEKFIDNLKKYKQGAKDAIRLKEQFADIDLDKHSTTKSQLEWLSQGDISYDSAVKNINQWIEGQREQKEKLISKLKGFGAESDDIGELQSNLKEREKIYLQLQHEQLLTEDIQKNYDAVNKEITEKIALLGKAAQAEKGSVGGFGKSTSSDTTQPTDTTTEVQNLENVRKKVEDIKTEVKAKTSAFTAEEAEVKRVAEAEIKALKPLEQKVKEIQAAIKGLDEQMPTDAPTESVDTPLAPPETPKEKLELISEDEITKLTQLRDRVKEITGEIKSTINNVVTDETSLQKSIRNITAQIHSAIVAERGQLDKLNSDIENVTKNIKGLLENIKTDEIDISAGLSNINVTVNHPKTQQNDLDPVAEAINGLVAKLNTDTVEHKDNGNNDGKKDATETTAKKTARDTNRINRSATKIYSTLKSIKANENSISSLGDIIAKDATLADILDAVNEIKEGIKSGDFTENAEDRAQDIEITAKELGELQARQDVGGNVELLSPKMKRLEAYLEKKGLSKEEKDAAEQSRSRGYKSQLSELQLQDSVRKDLIIQDDLKSLHKRLGEAEGKFKATGEIDEDLSFFIDDLKKDIESKMKLLLNPEGVKAEFEKIQNKSKNTTIAQIQKDKEESWLEKYNALKEKYEKQARLQAEVETSADPEKELRLKRLGEEVQLEMQKLDLFTKQRIEKRKELETAYEAAKTRAEEELAAKGEKKSLKDQMKEARQEARISKMTSTRSKGEDTLVSLWKMEDIPIDALKKLPDVTKLQDALKTLKATRSEIDTKIKSGQDLTIDDSDKIKTAIGDVNKYSEAIKELIKNYEFFSDDNSTDLGRKLSPGEDVKTQLIEAAQALHGGKIKVQKYDAATQQLTYTVKSGEYEFTNYTAGVRDVDKALRTVQGTTKKTETLLELIGRKTKDVLTYFSGSTTIYKGIEELRKGIQYIREIDAALTELKKVTDETETSYDRFLNTASKTADKIGSTITDVTLATATFAKLGYEMNLAAEMAEAALVYQNVGDGIESADEAANSIISTMNGFGLQASDAMAIVDRFNQVGNEFQATSKGIGEALERSASALSESGNTIDESIGLIVAANSVINDTEKVGTALKTLSLRLRGASVELQEAGLDADNMAESTSRLQQKLLALTHGEVNIMLDADTFKSTTQIIREMADAWSEMTDIERAAALELMGGKQQANVLAALIQNFDIAEDAIKSSANSTGSALRENEKYLDSIQGKIDQFTNSVQTMWHKTLDDEWIKWFVEAGTVLTDFIGDIGLLRLAIAGLMVWLNKKTFNISLFEMIGQGTGKLIHPVDTAKKKLKELERAYEDAKKTFESDGSDANKKAMEAAESEFKAFEAKTAPMFEVDKLKQDKKKLKDYLKNIGAVDSKDILGDIDVGLDTSELDAQIKELEIKLKAAKNKLEEIQGKDFYLEQDYDLSTQQKVIEGLEQEIKTKKQPVQDKIGEIDRRIKELSPSEALKIERENLKKELAEWDKLDGEQLDAKITTDGVEIDTTELDREIDQAKTKLAEAEEIQDELAQLQYGDKIDTLEKERTQKRREAGKQHTKQKIKALEKKSPQTSELTIAKKDLRAAKKQLKLREAAYTSSKSADVDVLRYLKKNANEAQEAVNKAKKKVDELKVAQKENGKAGSQSWKTLGSGVKDFAKQIGSALTQMLIMTAITQIITLAGKALDGLVTTAAEAAEAFEELNAELQSTKDTISNLESELDGINSQIDELYSKGTLSFTDQEQLELLKAEKAELENQIKLKKQLAEQQQQSVNSGAVEQAEYYKNKGVRSGKTFGENVGSDAGTVAMIGAGAGVALGVGGALIGGTKLGAALGSFAGPVGTAIGAALGALVGAGIGALVGIGKSATEETVGESMDNMKEQYDKLQKEYQDAQTKYHSDPTKKNKEKFEEAQKAFTDYQSEMAKYMTDMDAYYSSIDLSVYDPEKDAETIKKLRQEMNDFYDQQDKWAIASGGSGAKTTALDRIFGKNASDELKDIKQKINEAAQAGQEIHLEDYFSPNSLDDFTKRLYDMGIYLVDVENYFEDIGKTAADALNEDDFYNIAKSINSITDALSDLNSAIEEVNENGILSASTIVKLNETFGNESGIQEEWNHFVETMMSGTATVMEMQEATEMLAEAWLDEKLLDGPMSYAEKVAAAAQLEELGIKNAMDVIVDAQKEAGYDKAAEYFGNLAQKRSEYDKIAKIPYAERTKEEREKATSLSQEISILESRQSDELQNIAKQYGLTTEELEKHIGLLKQKAKLETKLADLNKLETAKKNKETYEAQLEQEGEYTKKTTVSGTKYKETYYDNNGNKISKEDYQAWLTRKTILQDKIDTEDGIIAGLNVEGDADQIQSEIDGINEQIETGLTNKTKLELELEITLGKTGTVLDEYTSKMEMLASIQSEVAKGFTISAEKAREFAAVYPEILKGATVTANGQIQLDKNVVNSILEKERTTQNAAIDTRINALRLQNAEAQSKIDFYKTQQKIAEEAAIMGTETAWQEAQDKLTASNILLGSLINNGVDEETAYQITTENMSKDTTEFQDIVKGVSENNFTNMDKAAKGAADSTAKNAEAMQNSLRAITQQAQWAAQAVGGIASGEVAGSTEIASGVTYGTSSTMPDFITENFTFDGGELSEKTTPAETPNLKELYGELIDPTAYDSAEKFMESLNGLIDSQEQLISANNGQIELLNGYKNRPLSSYSPDNNSGANGSEDRNGNGVADSDELQERIATIQAKQTYVQNEIALLEAQEETVSKSYYDELINQENEKLKLYEQEKTALKALYDANPTQETAKALWDIEHAIQESVVNMVKFRKSIVDLYKTAFDDTITAYDNKDDFLSDQQNYIDKQRELAELKDETITAAGYNKQITIEETKKAANKQELEKLKLLLGGYLPDGTWISPAFEEGSKEWIELQDKIRATEEAILDNDIAIEKYKKDIKDLGVDAFDDIIAAYDNEDNLLSDQQSYIDKQRELAELRKETITAEGYNKQIEVETTKQSKNEAELKRLVEVRDSAVANGLIEVGDEAWIAMEEKIRATEAAILDNKIAIEQYRQSMKQLSTDAFDKVRAAFNNQDGFFTTQQDYIEGYADYLEALGVDVPDTVYDKLIEIEKDKRTQNVTNLRDARQGLLDLETAGYTKSDEEWQNAYNKVTELEKKIQDNDIAIAQWNKTIRDMDFEKFDRFIGRLDDISSETERIQNLFSDEDVASEDGSWTKEGITSLGMLYQQMEVAKQKSSEYAAKISELNTSYKDGKMSEEEYYKRLQELKDGQWDAIESYEGAKDAIVDMEEARIDMIEEGINKEIEAYQDLIDVKRDELDAERDLHDFRKNVEKQNKDIASLERRIASLSGSTNAADIAERRRLEAELYEAKQGLDDTYYDHAKDQQGKALDDEMNAFQDAKESYLETLRETLDNTEELIKTKISEVLANADTVLATLNETADEHGVTLSSELTQPWTDASTETKEFGESVTAIINGVKTIVEGSTSSLTANLSLPWTNTTAEDGPISTFSTAVKNALGGAVTKAQTDAQSIKTSLTTPWTAGTNAVNTFSNTVATTLSTVTTDAETAATDIVSSLTTPWNSGTNAANTFSTNVGDALDDVITKANNAKAAIEAAANITIPNYNGSSGGGSGGGSGNGGGDVGDGGGGGGNGCDMSYSDVVALQEILNTVFKANIDEDGSYGPSTIDAVKAAQGTIGASVDGYYGADTQAKMRDYIQNTWLKEYGGSSMYGQAIQIQLKKLPTSYYAKGTTGTTKDQWAITDEPWLGDELVLVPTAQGNLQYMRKGTSVIPAEITKNLVEWGKISPNMANMSGVGTNLNVISNAINKPELNLNVENFLRCDNVSQDSMPELKRFVNEQMNNLIKQMNYGLKKVGAR